LANRIPTKDNLFRRGIVNIGSQLCSLGCGFVESLLHIFFVCECSHKVWCGVRNWLGIQGASSNNIFSHNALSFSGLHICFLKVKDSFKVIWLATIWNIWKTKNDWIFNYKSFEVGYVILNIQLQVWWWFKRKFKVFACSFYMWYSNHLLCLAVHDMFLSLARWLFSLLILL
jgi:hypothetical protein